MAATIRLRTTQFRKYAKLARFATDEAIANQMGLNPATLSRVLGGTSAPGERFIAGALTAFPELEFADLFEVVEVEAAA